MACLNNMNLRVKPFGLISVILVVIIIWIYFFGLPMSGLHTRTVSLKELLSASIDVAVRGGTTVRESRQNPDLKIKSKGKTREGKKQLYTDGDMASHMIMTYGLRKAFPSLTVISEEKTRNQDDVSAVVVATKSTKEIDKIIQDDVSVPLSDIAVWVDPLDATQEYTDNLVKFVTTMVCVAVKGVPIIGIIHRPFVPETVWAWVGHGHSANIKASTPSKGGAVKAPRIIVSLSHAGNVTSVAKKELGDDSVVIPAGGAGYKSLALVNGEADVYIHTTLIKKWDICAGDALLRELHGRMTDLKGKDLDYSASGDPKNEHGLLAAINNHDVYLQKFKVHSAPS